MTEQLPRSVADQRDMVDSNFSILKWEHRFNIVIHPATLKSVKQISSVKKMPPLKTQTSHQSRGVSRVCALDVLVVHIENYIAML